MIKRLHLLWVSTAPSFLSLSASFVVMVVEADLMPEIAASLLEEDVFQFREGSASRQILNWRFRKRMNALPREQ